jgi:hypothetical protein
MKKSNRYTVDIKSAYGAVRDTLHESYNEKDFRIYSPDVIEFRTGYTNEGRWFVKFSDIEYLENLCNQLNML